MQKRMTSSQFKKMKAKGKTVQSEEDMQDQICAYLKIRYPKIMYRIDLAGIHKSIGAAARMKRQEWGRGWPDLFIAEARGAFHGLFLEVKREDIMIYNAAGGYSSDHIARQAEVLEMLKAKGYAAIFSKGFDQARTAIDNYLSLKPYEL